MKMVKVCLAFVFGIFGPSSQWTVKSYPTLEENCQIQQPTLICDPDKQLVKQDRENANVMLHHINSVTECDCFDRKLCTNDTGGYTVGIAVIKSLEAFGPRMPGDPELIQTFAETTRHRWNLGHCSDDALVVVCTDCEKILLLHGDMTKRNKIPRSIQKAMQHEANQLRTFTNYTLVLDFLLTNYLTYLNNRNQTPSLSMMKFPFEDLSTGVITVMVLTSLLSVVWAVCVTYLVVQVICRRKGQKVAARKTSAAVLRDRKDSVEHNGSVNSVQRMALLSPTTVTSVTNGIASGPQLTRFELQRSPCWDRPMGWRWAGPRSSTTPGMSTSESTLHTSILRSESQSRKFGSEKRVHLLGSGRQKLDVLGLIEGGRKKKRGLRVQSFTVNSSAGSTAPTADSPTLARNESLPNMGIGGYERVV